MTAAATAVAVTATGGLLAWKRPGAASTAPTGVPTTTAKVTRTDLSTSTQVSGALGYRGDYSVIAQGAGGTLTTLPQPGTVIKRNEPVYEVNNRPVRLFYAGRPAFQPFAAGIAPGPDVRALEDNLKALGYLSTANNTFTSATTTAIRRWQRATGQRVNGRIELGEVTFQPGAIRIDTVTAKLGTDVRGGEPLLTATSTTAVVTINVPTGQTYLVHPGDTVTITLPDRKKVTGKVAYLSPVADDQPQQQDPGRGGQVTVPGIVTLDNPQLGANLDRAPVQVGITDETVTGVLAVPITALVALADGGYGVYKLDGAERILLGVTTGLFSDTLVEVRGDGLREGDDVEVPSS
ncbi:peptidoglycan-binding protein [Rugosimonospora africana]|uniref:Peptidoglycan-binding protein n=1 Tax=Rugosimonospora africana TaxID=556532 RepID=A0A8J3QV86_9ACTN|nr:peptidoglycan-binding protein [Rugosimonospora africana]